MGDGSLDAVPGITPRPDRRDITLPVAMPSAITRKHGAELWPAGFADFARFLASTHLWSTEWPWWRF
jgi:hypothetical protein